MRFSNNAQNLLSKNSFKKFLGDSKKLSFLFLIILICQIPGNLYAQSFTFFDNPVGFQGDGSGYEGYDFLRKQPIVYNGKLYMLYVDDSQTQFLAEFDGSTLNIIPNPAGYTSSARGYMGNPIIYNDKLYLRFEHQTGRKELVEYDGIGYTVYPSPTGYESVGYTGTPILYNGNLYMRFQNNSFFPHLVEFDGTTLTPFETPDRYQSVFPFVYNGYLYGTYMGPNTHTMGRFDGTNITLLPNPSGFDGLTGPYIGNGGFLKETFTYNDNVYALYVGNDGVQNLVEFDGANYTVIANPAGLYTMPNRGYQGEFYEYNGDFYLFYRDDNYNNELFRFDGTTLTHIPAPTGYSDVERPFAYNGKLYVVVDGTNRVLGEVNGTTVTVIPNPTGYALDGLPIVYNGRLYIGYENIAGDFIELFSFDGTTLTRIPSPVGYDDRGGYSGGAIIYDGDLYLSYGNDNGARTLGRFDPGQGCAPVTDLYAAGIDLLDAIEATTIPYNLENSLKNQIIKAGNRFCSGDISGALLKLNSFMNRVESKRGDKFTNEEADDLICQAQAIYDGIDSGIADGSNLCNNPNSRLADPALSINIQAYPNPFKNDLTIVWEEDPQEVEISLINAQGQRVFLKNMLVKGEHTIQVPALPAGMYILNVTGEGISQKMKLIKD